MRARLAVIALAVPAAVFAWTEYSSIRARLVAQREAIDAEWSQLDLAIEARADLVSRWMPRPGSGGHDSSPWSVFWNARATLSEAKTPSQKIQANSRISEALAALPKPARGESGQRLSDAENRIAVERRRYNEMLEHYNAQIQRFPDNVAAALAGFGRDDAYLPTEPETQP